MNWKIAALLCGGFAVVALLLWSPAVEFVAPTAPGTKSLEAVLTPPTPVRTMLVRACYDCHSNYTRLPWYAHFRPAASMIRYDIDSGRAAVNFTEWSREAAGDANWQFRTLQSGCSLMQAGMMPPNYYVFTHPGSKPTQSEIQAYCAWTQSFGLSTIMPNTQ
jgi:hypothetical protein